MALKDQRGSSILDTILLIALVSAVAFPAIRNLEGRIKTLDSGIANSVKQSYPSALITE